MTHSWKSQANDPNRGHLKAWFSWMKGPRARYSEVHATPLFQIRSLQHPHQVSATLGFKWDSWVTRIQHDSTLWNCCNMELLCNDWVEIVAAMPQVITDMPQHGPLVMTHIAIENMAQSKSETLPMKIAWWFSHPVWVNYNDLMATSP